MNNWQQREQQRLMDGTYKPIPLPLDYPASHYVHLSTAKTEEDYVAYTPSDEYGKRDRQVRLKFGRYLHKTFELSNPYDAESLLTGAEVVQGLDYDNSYRQWPDEATKRLGAEGKLSTEEVLRVAPRVRKEAGVKPGVAETGYPLRDTDW